MQAIDNLDEGVLHADLLPQLVAIVPEKPELTQVKESIDAYGGYEEVRGRLGAAETFYMELHRVQRVNAKVKVLQFKQEFVGDLADIKVHKSPFNTCCCISVLSHCTGVSGLYIRYPCLLNTAGCTGQG